MSLKTSSVKRKTNITITQGAQNVLPDVPIKSTSRYGLNFITSRSILNRNYLIKNIKFNANMRRTQFIAPIKEFLAEGTYFFGVYVCTYVYVHAYMNVCIYMHVYVCLYGPYFP